MSLTYPEVGATAGELPGGYHHVRASRVVGAGDELFEQCAETVMTWGVQRGAGLRVQTASPRVAVDGLVRVGMPVGPLTLWAPCRVVYVVEEPARRGFAYGTLPGHPESGEESFVVTIAGDVVTFEIATFSRPARWFSRLGAPMTRRVQGRITERYLRAVG